MTARRITFILVACDVCDYVIDQDEDSVTYFKNEAEARAAARALRWPVTTGPWICPYADADHQAALDALLPPAPEPVCDGQGVLFEEPT